MSDPYEGHLRQAADLFAGGEVVKAGQIWQAILKQVPSHAEARAGLMNVKAILEARKAAEAQERLRAPGSGLRDAPPDPEVLLREGCTLYDMGQTEEALRVWERLLAQVPGHALARDYANAARKELGLQTSAAPPAAPAPVPLVREERHDDNPDLDKLLREAVQLYDMGLPEEAIAKWEQALAQAPERQDIAAFIREARKEVEPRTPAPAPKPAPSPTPVEDPAAAKVRQGRHLLSLRRFDEAVFTFQQALATSPGHPEALEGLRAAQQGAPDEAPEPAPTEDTPIGLAEESRPVAALAPQPQQAQLPAALTRSQPGGREGLHLPPSMAKAGEALERFPWLKDPKVLAGLAGGLLLLATTCNFLRGRRAEALRRDEVQAVSEAALAEAALASASADLTEKPAELLAEAKEALEDSEPLKAFYLAERVLALTPGDGRASKVLEEARGALPGGLAGPSIAEAQRHLHEGNLDAAAKVYDALLRLDPSAPVLRAKAARVELALASAYAGQEKWNQTESHLRLGRALQPADRTWALRLHMLAYVKGLPKGPAREAWVAFLG